MKRENAGNQRKEKLSEIRKFLKDSNQLKKQLRDALSEVDQVRQKLKTFLDELNGLQIQGLDELMSDRTDGTPTDREREAETRTSTDVRETETPEAPGQPEEAERNEPLEEEEQPDRPVKAGDFASGNDVSWSEEIEKSSARREEPVEREKEQEENDKPSYQRRMVRKDPRFEDLPAEVLEHIADIEELIQEAERGIQFLDSLSVKSRSAQIAIWAGRARKLQEALEEHKEMLPSELFQKIHVFFGKLTTVTRDTECEWIDALKRSYETDWNRYLEEQKRKLKLNLQREKRAREFLKEPPEERKKDRKICRRRLRELASKDDPDQKEVKSALSEGMDLLALDDPAVTEVAGRFSDLLEGEEEFEPLRQMIKDQSRDRSREEDKEEQPEVHPRPTIGPNIGEEVLRLTEGKNAIAVGNSVTRDWRRRIESAFKFSNFRWIEADDQNGEELDSLKQDENVNQFDYIFLMKSRLEDNYSRACEMCDDLSPETLVVEEGVGIAPIRDTLKEEHLNK